MTWWHSNTIFNTYTGHESTESVHVATSLEKPKMNLPKEIQTFKKALAYHGRSVVEECVTDWETGM